MVTEKKERWTGKVRDRVEDVEGKSGVDDGER